jgi:hypothetical protein
VQPVALIVRAADGGRHGIEALYVTETDSKVYLGSVATGTCGGGEIAPGSGVVYSVAKSDVDAMRVGRRQRVAEAGRAAASLLDGLVRTAGTFPDPGASPTRVSGNETDTTGQGRKPWPLRLTHDRAVRQEPRIDSVVPASAATGQRIDINGDGFGSRPGRVVVGSRPARLITWDDELIKAIVPPRARTSRIRVHCPGPHAIVTVPRR